MQELHEQELGGHQAQQGGLQEAQAEVERSLPNWLLSSVRQNRSDRHSEDICMLVSGFAFI